ncbi:hypothetical protein H4S07_006317, partial [Coemansia furcata]
MIRIYLYLSYVVSPAADPNTWPDPATAASETTQPQTPSVATKPVKKGKGKWTPLEAEIQYPKPKNAIQTPATPRQPKNQQQNGAASNGTKHSTGVSAKDGSDTSSAKGAKSSSNSSKRQPRTDVQHDQQSRQTTVKEVTPVSNNGNGNDASTSTTPDVANQQSQTQGHTSRGPRQTGRGRGRGRGGQTHATQSRRGGYRATGHAPSHYQGKGNVQAGGYAPLP